MHSQKPTSSTVDYDPDRFPPDLEFAEKHGVAKRVAFYNSYINKIDVCECCGLPIENELIPICSSRTILASFGAGYPLYFEFLIFCISLLFLIFTIFAGFSLYLNLGNENCDELGECFSTIWKDINSVEDRTQNHELFIQRAWVILIAVFLSNISIYVFRWIQYQTEQECDRGLISPSDFTIMIGRLPKGSYTEQDIVEIINKYIQLSDNEKIKGGVIKKIDLAYELNEYFEAKKFVKEIKKKFREKNYKHEDFDKNHLESQKNINIKFIAGFEIENSLDAIKLKQETNGVVFVTFKDQHISREIVEQYKFSFQDKFARYVKRNCNPFHNDDDEYRLMEFEGKTLYVSRAPEPNDIFWENLGFSHRYRFKKKVVTLMITMVVLAFCFSITFSISYFQHYLNMNNKKNALAWLSSSGISKNLLILILGGVGALLIVVINSFLSMTIQALALSEKPISHTHYNISVAEKLSISQFINTALIIFLANYLTLSKKELFKKGGLISDVLSVFFTTSFIPLLIDILDPFYFLKLYKIYILKKEGSPTITQDDANLMFEGPSLNMSLKYASLIKTVFFAAFYVSIIPIGCLIAGISLILRYWTEKYLILRRYARTPILSAELNNDMVELIEYCPLIMSLGTILFHYIIFNPNVIDCLPELLAIGISVLNFIFPAHYVVTEIAKKKGDVENDFSKDILYEDNRKDFSTDYDRENPVTKRKAMREYVQFVEKGEINMVAGSNRSLIKYNPNYPSIYFVPHQN